MQTKWALFYFISTAARHLQETLIEEYKRIGFEVPLSPIYEGLNDDLLKVNIDELYTDPVIVKPEKKEEIPLTSYKDVFRGKERANRTIFLKGEAGVGKTTWCIQLLYAWVKTHDKDFEKSVDHKTYSSNSSNDKVRGLEEALSQFDFFFIVPLRYVKGKTSIKDVLFSPLLERLSSHESTVCSIIKRCSDKVLILLDGIDEYTEDLSYEGLNQCTVVTTSRPWKYDHICATNPGLKIDLVLALKGLDLFGIKQLAKRICMVKSKYEASDMSSNQSRVFDDDIVENFITHVSNSGLTDALKVPLTLIILLETYIENDSLSHSMTSNLVNLVEVLVQRGEEKTMGSKLASSAMSTSQENIIALFGENESLSDYACLLQKLSKLAFNGIISSQKENALVFSEKQLSKLFTEDEICLCLKFGLLSKSRYFPSKLKKMKESLSFYHKLVQEFFVATWIASSPEAVDKFKTSISSVTDILEIENVFIFVCGIDAHIGSELSKHFVEVCKKDCYTQGQITGVGNSGSFPKDLVNMSGLMLKGQKEVDNSTKMLEPLHILDMYYVHVLSSPETEKSLLKLLTTSTHCLRRLWCNQLQRMVSHNGIFKLLNIIGDAVELQELILSDEFEPTNCSLHGDEIQTLHLDFSRHEKLHTVTLLIFNSESNPCFALCLPILTALRSLPNLKYIDLCGHELDPSNILVEVIPRLQNLESLSLRNFSILSGDLMVESKELRNLVILGIDIEKSCVMLKTSCKLERVTIDDLKMSKTGWPVLLEQLGEQNDLIELHLLKIDIKGARLNFSKMGKLQDLEVDSLETPAVIVYNEMDPNKLTLKDVKMNASAWATLFSAFRFKNLKYLHFIQLDVGHAEIDLSQATQLETLAFTDVKFCPVASGNRKEPMKTHQERHIYTAWERIFNSLPTKNLRQLELSRLDIGTALIQIDTKSCLSTIGLEDVVMSRKAFAILHSSLKSLSKLSNVAIIKAKVEGITITMSLEDIRK